MPEGTQKAVAAADEVEAKADAESQARAEADAAFEEEQRDFLWSRLRDHQ